MKVQHMLEVDRSQCGELPMIERIREIERHGWVLVCMLDIDRKTMVLFEKEVEGFNIC